MIGGVTIKILEKGPGWSIKLKCTGYGHGDGGCDSLLEVEKDDIYVSGGDGFYDYVFCCPVCNVETRVNEKDLPESIQREKLSDYRNKILEYKKKKV